MGELFVLFILVYTGSVDLRYRSNYKQRAGIVQNLTHRLIA